MSKLTSGITMTFAVLLFIGGSILGVVLLLQPASTQVEEEQCDKHTVQEGDDLTPNLVTLNVFNSGEKAGLANRVSINLQRNGFLAGEVGNAPEDVTASSVTIFAQDPDHPAVKLLAEQFKGKVKVDSVPDELPADSLTNEGIAIVIGAKYDGLKKKAPREVESDRAITVCVPLEQAGE